MWLVSSHVNLPDGPEYLVARNTGGPAPGMHVLEASFDAAAEQVVGELAPLVWDVWTESKADGLDLPASEQLALGVQQRLNADG